MGRAKKSNSKRQFVAFAATESEKNLLLEKAKSMGLSLSAFIRYRLLYEKKEG